MKKLFTLIMVAAAIVGCSKDINEEVSVNGGARYTAPLAIDVNNVEVRTFDSDLSWVWEDDDIIVAYQDVEDNGYIAMNNLAKLANGNFGNTSFGYQTMDAADFVFVHPSNAFNKGTRVISNIQDGEWNSVLLGRVENTTVKEISTVPMQHLNAAVEFRFWDAGAEQPLNVTSITLASESDFVATWDDEGTPTWSGKSLSVSDILRDNYTFNIGADKEFAFALTITDENGTTKTIDVPSKSYAAGSRTIINVEWATAIDFNLSSWWTDQSKEPSTIYISDITLDRAADYEILLDGATTTVTDGKISGLASGEHKVKIRVKGRGNNNYHETEKSIIVTTIPTLDFTVSSSYNNNKGAVSKTNSINGYTINYAIGSTVSDNYIQTNSNILKTVSLHCGSSNATGLALNQSGSLTGVAMGEYKPYIVLTLTLGSHTVNVTMPATSNSVHVTGIPSETSLEVSSAPAGWITGGKVNWDNYSALGGGGNYLRLRADKSNAGYAISSAYHIPANLNVTVTADCFHYFSNFFVSKTSTLYINPSNESKPTSTSNGTSYKQTSDYNDFNDYDDAKVNITLTNSTPRVGFTTNFTENEGGTRFFGIKTMDIKYTE